MHVDAYEEIDSAVAAVLVIVTFELTRHGRDRLAYLADQLDRALVEARHWPLWIGARSESFYFGQLRRFRWLTVKDCALSNFEIELLVANGPYVVGVANDAESALSVMDDRDLC
jgi:hypothetical protein